MFIDSNEAKLFTTGYGPARLPTIVGIGGWIGSWELWAEPFSILSESWRTIAYDHRGSGASLAPIQTITYDNLVADLFAVLDAYQVKECTLAAESAGALIALGAALKDPGRITRLVIVDGLYHRSVVSEDSDTFLNGLRVAYSATLDRFIDLCIPEPNCEHIKRWGRQILDRASQESAIALRKVGSGMDIRDKLTGIVQPTLIIHGDMDNIVPMQQAHELNTLIPGSKLAIFPGAGHVPTLTRPLEVAAEISAFLKDLKPNRRA